MHFIEHIFGISPDGGSGLLELVLLLVPSLGIAALYVRRKFTRLREPSRFGELFRDK
jgi:hypothetical protein